MNTLRVCKVTAIRKPQRLDLSLRINEHIVEVAAFLQVLLTTLTPSNTPPEMEHVTVLFSLLTMHHTFQRVL
jgi:cell division protein ZapA (FtsZ GTPase activity inhibitor)